MLCYGYIEETGELYTHAYDANQRRWWVKPINQLRTEQGATAQLIQQMRDEDDESFFNFTRMTIQQFDYLLELVGPSLQKFSNREGLTPETRLLVTLR